MDLPDSESAKAIVTAILGLGKSFGIQIVAEGIETVEQLQYSQQNGCDMIQGCLIGRPNRREIWSELRTTPAFSSAGCFPCEVLSFVNYAHDGELC